MARNRVCAQDRHTPYPIIFVHGLTGNDQSWNVMVNFMKTNYGFTFGGRMDFCLNQDANTLTSNSTDDYKDYTNTGSSQPITKGDLYTVNFDVDEFGTPYANSNINKSNQSAIVKQGLAVRDAIKHVLEITGCDKVILVGHSMGGLASREYLQNKNLWNEPYVNHHVAKLLTIGTPHGGSNATDWGTGISKIDLQSEAVRDLRASYFSLPYVIGNKGVYLLGGVENLDYMNDNPLGSKFYNADVNCNGMTEESITGLNNKSYPIDLAYSCIIGLGDLLGADSYPIESGDGIVSKYRANINNFFDVHANVFEINKPNPLIIKPLWHTELTKQTEVIMKGLDEPDDPTLAYEIGENRQTEGFNIATKGFITFQQSNYETDIDLFKIVLKKEGTLKISLLGNESTGIKAIDLLDVNSDEIKVIKDINGTIEEILKAGTYYIWIYGIATKTSFNFPYTLQTQFVPTPVAMSVSPDNLDFSDVVINVPKHKTITLTNNGSNSILVTGIGISDKVQFTASPIPPFAVTPDLPLNVTVTFNPTSVGAKTATLEITTYSLDIPTKTITLSGNGTDHETKVLVCSQTSSYNFGDTKLSNSKSNTFTIQNTGSKTLTVSNLAIEGLNPDPYTIVSPTIVPFDIASGATKQISIKFLPTSLGAKTAALAITNNSDNLSPKYSIALNGNGTQNYYTGSSTILIGLEYWFDEQYQAKKSLQLSQESVSVLNAQIPTDGLTTGLHSINIRYQDIKGNWSSVVSGFFHRLPATTAGSPKITSSEYWFDDNYSTKVSGILAPDQKVSVNTGFEVSSLVSGLHSYHVRYKDDAGQWSSIVSEFFQKIPVATSGTRNITASEYWIDEDYANKVSTALTPGQTISVNGGFNVESLSTGLHNYNVRFKDDAGQWSSVVSEFFHKLPVTATGIRKITNWEYWFDDNYSTKVSASVTPDQLISVNTGFKVDSLSGGLHSYHIRYKDDAGQWSSIVSEFFQKIPVATSGTRNIIATEYWIDEDYANKVSSEVTPGQTISVNGGFNVESLTTGLHSYYTRFKDDAGQWSSVVSEFFHKLPTTTTGIRKITDWEYWFDDDYTNKITTAVTPDQLISVNTGFKVDSLSCGLHSYHVRYKDDAGQWTSIVSEFFQKIPVASSGTRNITATEYWIDEDYANKVSTAVTPGQTISVNGGFNVESLSTGLHSYYTHFKDDAGQWSSVVSEFFHKLPVTTTGIRKITDWEYWFDDDYTNKITTAVTPDQLISVNTGFKVDSLSGGLHSYHVRYKDDAGQWSSIVSEFFQKIPVATSGTRNITTTEYWIDEDYANKVSTAVTPGQTISVNGGFNVESLSTGLHSYHVRYKDDAGQWSSVVSEFFHKLPTTTTGTRKITNWEYWFDDDFATKVTTSISPDQLISVNNDFEVGLLTNGLHSYHVRYKDNAGQWSSIVSELFQKLNTTGGQANVITAYRYWFDRNEKDMITVNIENTQNPYLLIKNLNTCNLSLGNHTVHLQFRDLRLGWSSATNNTLIKSASNIPEITFVGSTTFCQGESITLIAPTAESYLWSNGATTSTIKVTESGNYSVQVNTDSSCSLSSVAVSVVVNPFPDAAESIVGATIVTNNQNNVIYTVSPILNANSYIWTLPVGVAGTSNTNTITVNFDNATLGIIGEIKVKGRNNCGDGLESSLTITIDKISGFEITPSIDEVNVYPNPVTDGFYVSGFEGTALLKLTDINGRLLLASNITSNEFVSIKMFSKSVYIVKIITSGGITERKLVKK